MADFEAISEIAPTIIIAKGMPADWPALLKSIPLRMRLGIHGIDSPYLEIESVPAVYASSVAEVASVNPVYGEATRRPGILL